jgi:hypothetical protein
MSETQITIYQTMGVCLIFIISFVAYGVSLRRKERRRRQDLQDVMWKKVERPTVSPVKVYQYNEPAPTPHADIPPPNRAERRKGTKKPS